MALWGKQDQTSNKPKYLSDAEKNLTVGVDITEAETSANINKGINTPGWVKYTTYTDAQGSTRNKSEVLVAMSTISTDASSAALDPWITIGTQPTAVSVTSPADAVFTVAATINTGATPTYQWEVSTDGGSTWANSTAAAGTTAATLTVVSTDADYVDANEFRVVVSGTAVAANVTSNAAVLSVA
jgi:hypothetical protein